MEENGLVLQDCYKDIYTAYLSLPDKHILL